jgi:hypothetical protein
MKADPREELDLLNRNVDEMIRLFQRATDAGVWTPQDAARHEARLELVRAKLNSDFREIIALGERPSEARERARKESPPLMPKL